MKGFLGNYKSELLVGLLIFVFVAPLGGAGGANQLPRIALAVALVDTGSVEITPYQSELDVDFAIRDGRLYSDKAPGSSFMFAPVYAVYRLAGGSDMLSSPRELRFLHKLVVASIPAALLAGLMAGYLRPIAAKRRSWVSLMLAAGTMLLPFATVAFGHILAAFLAFSGFLLAKSARASWWTPFAAGFIVAFGVTVEYPLVIVAVALLIYLWLTAKHKVLPFVLGGIPFAVALLTYHYVAFGHPLQTSYRYAQTFNGEFSGVGLGWPDPGDLFNVLIGERGLLILTPVVLLAVMGFLPFFRRRSDVPTGQMWLILGIVAAFVVVPAIWIDDVAGPYGGWSPGPRFVVPALPFLVLPLLGVLQRWPRTTSIVGGWSIAVMVLATLTRPLAAHDTGVPAITQWWDLATSGSARINVLAEALGPLGWAVHLGATAVIGVVLIRQVSTKAPVPVS